MNAYDDHVQHVWNLTHPALGELTLELWTDGYTVRVHGGPDDGEDDDRGRKAVDELLSRYAAAGWQAGSDYAVNDPATHDDEDDTEPEGADQRPDSCPECGSHHFEYEPNVMRAMREGPAWMCAGGSCSWGQWIAV